MRTLIAWQGNDFVSDFYFTGFNLSLESTESMVRTAHSLYRHIEALFLLLLCYIYFFKVWKQCLSLVPANFIGFGCYIITFCCRNRNNVNAL